MTEVITYSFSKRHEQLRAVVARYAILHLEGSGEQLDDIVQNILIKIWQKLEKVSWPYNKRIELVGLYHHQELYD
jgi:Sigma-70 region 2.